jgi:cyclic pyranopterin phosphate synthase
VNHLDEKGQARMVEVGQKPETARLARASGRIEMSESTLHKLLSGDLPKGEALAVARLAAIQAVKRTADLIPLCHPLRITGVDVEFTPQPGSSGRAALHIRVEVRAFDRTGVEMEALTAVSVAALTVYDMCKAVDKGMCIAAVMLDEKHGGKSGTWLREPR